MRVAEAMDEVVAICMHAISNIEKKRGAFAGALKTYFWRAHKATDTLSKAGLNKK